MNPARTAQDLTRRRCAPENLVLSPPRARRRLTVLAVALVVVLPTLLGAPGAQAAEGAFGIESFTQSFAAESGGPATVAGSHPYSMTTTIVFGHRVLTEAVREGETERIPFEVEIPAQSPGGVKGDNAFSPKETRTEPPSRAGR